MSHLLRAILVASMLAGVAGSHAGEAAHRQDLNGARKNGLDQNGIRKNGIQLNRLAFNGIEADRHLNGAPLQSLRVR